MFWILLIFVSIAVGSYLVYRDFDQDGASILLGGLMGLMVGLILLLPGLIITDSSNGNVTETPYESVQFADGYAVVDYGDYVNVHSNFTLDSCNENKVVVNASERGFMYIGTFDDTTICIKE